MIDRSRVLRGVLQRVCGPGSLCFLAACGGSSGTPDVSGERPVPEHGAVPTPSPAPPPLAETVTPAGQGGDEAPAAPLPLDPSAPEVMPPAPPAPPGCSPWPSNTGTEEVADTIEVSGTFDGGLKRFVGIGALGSGSQNENQPTFFALEDGAVLKNVILGAPAADGIHCNGSCVLENVWWEDVGEDAATFSGERDTDVMSIRCAGARQAEDKIFQHNGPGTMLISDFFAEGFGKVYRSCGNCREQFDRHVEINNLIARDGDTLAGINENFGDTASFENVSIEREITVCQLYRGNDTGAEPLSLGDGPDAEHCLYREQDILPL